MRIPVQSLWSAVTARFEGIVSARIADAAERRRHAGLLAALVTGSLTAALFIPLAGFHGGTSHVVGAAVASSLCLGLAATLAATAAFDAVIAAAVAGAAMLLGVGAVFDGGPASPLIFLLPVAPIEALLSGRRQLFRACFGIASLGVGFVLAASAAGFVSAPDSFDLSMLATAGALAVYGLCRSGRILRATPRRTATVASEASGGCCLVRFAPDGALVEAAADARMAFGEKLDGGDRLPFALALVHVADRVRYLAAFGDVRAGADGARCEARLWNDARGGFVEAAIDLFGLRMGGDLLAIEMTVAGENAAAPAAGGLEEALEAARAGSEAKSNFLAMVSHELRTPLNAIIGFSDILDRELFGAFPDPRQKEYVGLIRQSGEHLLSVVNGLLDISKIEAGRYELVTEPFDIAEVLETAVATVRCEAERKGLTLLARNDCVSGSIVADRRAVHQILLNLIANAVKFTEAGHVEVRVREIDGFMRIAVSDTGIGIPAAEIPRLGQPFTQGSAGLTRRYPGTGLGLSLVKGFAELHHGSLSVSSEPGRGTTVEVKLSLDCTRAIEQNETVQKIVSLKHVRSPENHVPFSKARRSA